MSNWNFRTDLREKNGYIFNKYVKNIASSLKKNQKLISNFFSSPKAAVLIHSINQETFIMYYWEEFWEADSVAGITEAH